MGKPRMSRCKASSPYLDKNILVLVHKLNGHCSLLGLYHRRVSPTINGSYAKITSITLGTSRKERVLDAAAVRQPVCCCLRLSTSLLGYRRARSDVVTSSPPRIRFF